MIGKEIIKIASTRIINSSIESGTFPREWIEAVVTPIFKKGDPTDIKLFITIIAVKEVTPSTNKKIGT